MSQVNGYTDCVNQQSVMGLPPPEETFADGQCIQDDANGKANVEATFSLSDLGLVVSQKFDRSELLAKLSDLGRVGFLVARLPVNALKVIAREMIYRDYSYSAYPKIDTSIASLVELVKEERGIPVHGEYIYRDTSDMLRNSMTAYMYPFPISREEYIDLRERFRNQQ